MSDDTPAPRPETATAPWDRPDLPEAARRALREAEERRQAAAAPDLPPELGGRDGPEPVRYGDWERKGLAIDF
ncbi:MAG: DUF1674 domain-containing protein [Rhodobacteraceae bacterium]|nr:DUF1674 domain-containing protein [Paracoccaceae bacterium]